MSVISLYEPPSAADGAVQRGGFWKRLTQALDKYSAERTRLAVPQTALRRCRRDIERFRRLAHQGSRAAADGVERATPRCLPQ